MKTESNRVQDQRDEAASLALVRRAHRAIKARGTRSGTAVPEGVRGVIERHGDDSCIVLRSTDGELVAEYLVESGDKLRWLADGPARHAARQEAELRLVESLEGEVLIARATECLHALNRLAKHIPRVWSEAPWWSCYHTKRLAPMAERIYGLKDQFLDAMVRAGRATVGVFVYSRATREMTCEVCDRQWTGDSWCYACEDYCGVAEKVSEKWFLVDCGRGYRFHRPNVSTEVEALAIPIEPHDPTQPRRDVPDVGLGVPAQLTCMERAISFLLELSADDVLRQVARAGQAEGEAG